MTSRTDAVEAARVFRDTQPEIDALKDTLAANKAAKEILGAYMLERKLDVFRGVTLTCVAFTGWNSDKLNLFLGEKVAQFRTTGQRKHFGLARRKRT